MATATSALLIRPGIQQSVNFVGYDITIETTNDERLLITIDGTNASSTDFVQLSHRFLPMLWYEADQMNTLELRYPNNIDTYYTITNIKKDNRPAFTSFEDYTNVDMLEEGAFAKRIPEHGLVWKRYLKDKYLEAFYIDDPMIDQVWFDLYKVHQENQFQVFKHLLAWIEGKGVLDISKESDQLIMIKDLNSSPVLPPLKL